jgi:transposase InsO family protein
MPAYIHSDRGATFMSEELRTFRIGKGVATSRTTSYNPEGNGQVQRYNGIIWKEIVTCLKSKHLPVKYWQDVLADAYIRCAHFYVQRQTRHPMNVSLAFPEDQPLEALYTVNSEE